MCRNNEVLAAANRLFTTTWERILDDDRISSGDARIFFPRNRSTAPGESQAVARRINTG
jgi:hypothetical protein